MRIAYLISAGLPSRETDTQQAMKTVDALLDEGAEVSLVLPDSRRLRARGAAAFAAELRQFYSLRHDPPLVPLRGLEPGPALEAHRPFHALRAGLTLPRDRFDLVYTRSRSAPLWCAWRGLPFVFETYRPLGRRHPWLAALYVRLSRRPSFLGIVTHSELARSSLERAGFPVSRLAAIHNGHDPDDVLPQLTREEARAELGLGGGRPLVCYTGNVGARKGLSALLELARLTPEADYLVIGGHEHEIAAFRQRTLDLANVRCAGWRPARALAPYLYAADVLLIPPTAAPLERHGRTVLPMKTFSYLAAGRPILAPDLPDLREVLVHGESACLVAPDDAAQAAAALRRLTSDRALVSRLERGALERAAAFTWRARARRLLAQIEEWRLAGRAG